MRNQWLDIVKGIAIILVCVGHSRVVENDYAASWIYSFHMPIFFFAAGYCFDPNKALHIKDYFVRKLRVLAYPYVMLSIFGGILAAVLYAGIGWGGVLKCITRSVYPYPGCFMIGFWFLQVLFLVEIVFAAFKGASFHYLAVACAVLGFAVWPDSIDFRIPAFFRAMVLYYIGFSLRDVKVPLCVLNKAIAIKIVCLFVCAALHLIVLWRADFPIFHTGDLLGAQHPIVYLMSALLGSAIVVSFAMLIERVRLIGPMLAWIGRYSILLLTVHPICGMARVTWVKEFGFMNGITSVIAELILIAVLMWFLSGPLNFFMRIPQVGKGRGNK